MDAPVPIRYPVGMKDLDAILADLGPTPPRRIDEAALARLFADGELLREEAVFGGRALRLFLGAGRHLFQEVDDEGVILLRAYASREEAEAFVNRRLEDHERQWDG